MKKFNSFLVLLMAFTAGVFAQGPFTPISWITYPADVSWADNPYDKAEVTALKIKSSFELTPVADMDETNIMELWDLLGDQNNITFATVPGDGSVNPFDLDGDATYGAAFKTFWDDENLYVLLKFIDTNFKTTDATDADTRLFEICYAPNEKDRYDAGFDAAGDDITLKNKQYARFTELGGGKARIKPAGCDENVSSHGQDGSWGAALADPSTFETNWVVTGDNTVWAIVAFNFATNMPYLTDEWGATDASNQTAYDPTAEGMDVISFDVKAASTQDIAGTPGEVSQMWSSNTNDGFEAVYYNGHLTFSPEEFGPEGVENLFTTATKRAFIFDNILKFKGYDSPVNVDIYSVVGQKVKSATNVSTLNVSDLNKGLYIVKVGDDVYKVMK